MRSEMQKQAYCLCCGEMRYCLTQFRMGSRVCMHCEVMPVNEAVIQTRETIQRELTVRKSTREGRRAANMERRLAAHVAAGGKRCCECHVRKPATIDYYGTCATRGDGMQPSCKECTRTRAVLMKRPGGLQLWRTLRAALRARNDPAAPAASAPAAVTQQPLTEPGRIPG